MSTSNNNQSLSEGSREEASLVSEEEFMEVLEETGKALDFMLKSKNSDRVLHLLLIKEMLSFGELLDLRNLAIEILDAAFNEE